MHNMEVIGKVSLHYETSRYEDVFKRTALLYCGGKMYIPRDQILQLAEDGSNCT
jgi:hypothetical protein